MSDITIIPYDAAQRDEDREAARAIVGAAAQRLATPDHWCKVALARTNAYSIDVPENLSAAYADGKRPVRFCVLGAIYWEGLRRGHYPRSSAAVEDALHAVRLAIGDWEIGDWNDSALTEHPEVVNVLYEAELALRKPAETEGAR